MNVLLIGSGGREHALAWAIAASPSCTRLLAAPGNPGIEECATCVALDVSDHAAVVRLCRKEAIDLVVVGPEGPLVAGLVDALAAAGIAGFGPTRAAARLEGSKGFTKDLCREAGIPTAGYRRFADRDEALAHLDETGAPVVVKADGLAAGKGVVVAETLQAARAAVLDMLQAPGAEIVIEEFLEGEEASLFALCDGIDALPFASAQDHKRVHEGDRGPNTGGMGAVSPAPALTPDLERRAMAEIVRPTLRAMAARGTPFRGVLYAGLMLTRDGPQLIEYNVRFGDPEAQVLMPRLASDLLPALHAAATGRLRGFDVTWKPEAALCVVMAAKGYPGPVVRGSTIRGIEGANSMEGVTVFQAGTRREGERILADGGRVLGVTALAPDLGSAQARAYAAVDAIDWPEGFCRRDIGERAIRRAATVAAPLSRVGEGQG